MKNKELFIKALHTLFESWGQDTPPEVIWGSNELLDWYESEYNVVLGVRFEEDWENGGGCLNYQDVINAINKN